MLETDRNVVQIKSYCQKLRKVVNVIIFLLIALGLAYLMYWQLMTNDDWQTFEETKTYFYPLASVFFPEDPTNDVYRNTAFCLFACTIPVALLYIIIDIIKDFLIKSYFHIKDIQDKKEMEKEKANELLQYEVIKHISLCLSLGWETENNLTEDAKNKLNIGIYNKIKNTLSKANMKKDIKINKALVVKFDSFKNFDNFFNVFLNILASIKKQIEKSGNIEMIPTITVDAYVEDESFENIEKRHFKITSFNLVNKAISSTMFVKKYKFLNLKKYAGYSIGDYADFTDGDVIELHVIHDDLNDVLCAVNNKRN